MEVRFVLAGLVRIVAAGLLSTLASCIWRGPPAYAGHTSESQSHRCASIPFTLGCNGVARTVLGRSYCVHVPSGYRAGTRIPVVLFLHGYAGDGEGEVHYVALDEVADARTFLLLEPNGTNDVFGLHYWNASPACCGMFATDPPDDVAFLMAVLDDAESAFSVDTTREYVMGHSSGAFMAQRLACEHTERFAAVASLGGAADLACVPSGPISVLEIHGDADAVIHYDGGTNADAPVAYPSVDETIAYWVAADHCRATPETETTTDLVCDMTDFETHIERHAHCHGGTVVERWRMQGIGHLPFFRLPTWTDRVVDFLFAHRR